MLQITIAVLSQCPVLMLFGRTVFYTKIIFMLYITITIPVW